MKKILSTLLIPLFLISCIQEPDKGYQEPEYKILNYQEGGSIFCSFSYPSVDENGDPVTLSSALMAYNPTDADTSALIRSLIIACHITITSNDESPSLLKSKTILKDPWLMYMLPQAAAIPQLRQSLVIMPDYEGFGISANRSHPYLAHQLTAQQVCDAVKYGLEIYRSLAKALPFSTDWKSICIGYSQGGSAALATHKYIEQNSLDNELHFTGSFCAGGPYDLVETLRYYIMDDGHSDGVETSHTKGSLSLPQVLALIVKGMVDTHPHMKQHRLSDYFSKQFLDTGIMEWLDKKEKTTDDIAAELYKMCENGLTAADGTIYSPGQMQTLFPSHRKSQSLIGTTYGVSADLTVMLSSDLYEYLNDEDSYNRTQQFTGDRFDDLMAALRENSLVKGWEPVHKIVLLHSKYDTVVPFSNAVSFKQEHSDADIRLVSYGDGGHQNTGSNFYIALLNNTFSKEFTWLFAEK